MKLGVNLFSVRKFLKNEADVRESFRKIRDIGYEVVQLSGAAPMEAETVRKISRESGLPIVCTHSPLDRILHDTDALIREHREFGCPVIGLGALPKELRTKEADLHEWLATMLEPVAKIRAEVLRRLSVMLEEADRAGVTLCHENESKIYGQNPAEVADLLNALPGLYGVFDAANYVMNDADPLAGIEATLIRPAYLHMKDAIGAEKAIVPVGMGDGRYEEVLRRVDRATDGLVYLTVEPHLHIFDS